MQIRFRPLVLTTAAAALVSSAAAPASAQNVIPGDNSPAETYVTNPNWALITVKSADATAETVTATFKNTSGDAIRCEDPANTARGGTVTEDVVALKTLRYYSNFGVKPSPVIPMAVVGSSITADLSPILPILPGGSAGPAFGDANAAKSDIKLAQQNAAQRGHAGTSKPFNLNNNASIDLSFPLGPPSAGEPTDFNAAAVFVCRKTAGSENGQKFVVAGFENPPAATDGGNLNLGSLGRI